MADGLELLLRSIEGEGPSPDFVATLREQVVAAETMPADVADDEHVVAMDVRPKAEERMMTTTRWMLVGLAAAAIALIVGFVALTGDGDEKGLRTIDTDESTTTTTSSLPPGDGEALSIAASYMSALVDGEPLSQVGILADGAVFGDGLKNSSAAQHLLELVWVQAAGGRFWDEACELVSQDGDVSEVDCTYQLVAPWDEPLDPAPFTGRSTLRLGSSGIISISNSYVGDGAFSGDCPCMGPEPAAWARTYRPEAVDGIIEAPYSTEAEARQLGAAFGDLMDEWQEFNERYGCVRSNVSTCGPARVARRYLDARGALDVDDVLVKLAENIDAANEPSTRADLEAVMAFENAIGRRIVGFECTGDAGNGTVTCDYQQTNAWSRALGLDALRGGRFDFTVRDDGTIAKLTRVDPPEFRSVVWDPFVAWLEATHAEVADAMIDADGAPITSPEAIELWSTYTEEYINSSE